MLEIRYHVVQICNYNYGATVKFSWDEDKNTVNKRKHDISFEAAQYIFDDPFLLAVQDRFVDGEERWQTIGTIAGTTLLLVAHLDG